MRPTLFLLAAVLYGQSAPDPTVVLDQVRAKIRATMKRIPKYTCLQTVDRSYYPAEKLKYGETACAQLSADGKNAQKPPRPASTDRLRLEVAQASDSEIHSWPGSGRFDLKLFDRIVDSGPFGTGAFGGYLIDIFDNDLVQFDYRGEDVRDNHRLLVYGYSVARKASHYTVRAHDDWVFTAFSGTFELNPDSVEIERVILQTAELPFETGLCEAVSTLDYQRVEIGDGSFLLPRASQLLLIYQGGGESNSVTTFEGCREFHAESSVSFGTPTAALEAPDVHRKSRPPLPGGLDVDLRLIDSIDTDTSAAGDPVSATVVHDVRQSREILIPAGAVVHGRISRMEHHHLPTEYLVIGLSLQSVEIGGESVPFSARLQSGPGYVGPGANPSRGLTPRPIGPPNSFLFSSTTRHVIAAGTMSHWETTDPATAR
jgi:hypothetical protein